MKVRNKIKNEDRVKNNTPTCYIEKFPAPH